MQTEPTAEQCTAREKITLSIDGNPISGIACWYPQMGGYLGKAIAQSDGEGGCINVYVWHDGEFPFSEKWYREPTIPRRLHHCDPDQFISFGKLLKTL
jgi:hypothetical protein